MTELLELAALLAVIYLLDCLVVVQRPALGLMRFSGRWILQRPRRINRAWNWGMLIGLPIPPLSPIFLLEPLPVALGPDGLSSTLRGPTFLRWADITAVTTKDKFVRINGRDVAALATRRGAHALAARLRQLRSLTAPERTAQLEHDIDAQLSAEAVRARLASFAAETRWLALATNVLWLSLCGALLVLIRFPSLKVLVLFAVTGSSAWGAAVWLMERIVRTRWVEASGRPGASKRIQNAITPLSAIRSRDLLARELLGDLDPLAAAAAVLSASQLQAAARARFVALRYGPRTALAEAAETESWWRQRMLAAIERLLQARGIDPSCFTSPPARQSEDVVAWCPNCLSQYGLTTDRLSCTNEVCEEMPLTLFTEVAS